MIKQIGEKRILKTNITQYKDEINANQLFKDLEYVVSYDSLNGVKVDRKHPAQRIINRFSGQYMSPTMLKGFNDCQAGQLYGSLMPFVPSDITSIGQAVHSILENFYNKKPTDRNIDDLEIIMMDVIKKNKQESFYKDIKLYIDQYKEIPDYLDMSKKLDHKSLECYNELFMKGTASPLGVKLPMPIYTLLDRLDFRDEGIFTIDYKIGLRLDRRILTMDGYLPQLICYNWMVEETYGVKPTGSYLCIPGTKEKYAKLETSSLKNQSMLIDRIFEFNDKFREVGKTKIYKETKYKWCNYCKLNKFCNLFNNNLNETKEKVIEIEYDITLTEDNYDKEILEK